MWRTTILTTLDPAWSEMVPIPLGRIPGGRDTPDCFVTVESNDGPALRVDLYRSSEECFAFQEACVWSGLVVLGWGNRVYLLDPPTRLVSSLNLGSYFGHLYPGEGWLLVASGERLFRVDRDGTLCWQSDVLGIDGVVVHQVIDGVVQGDGEWDPPGGWQPFQIDLSSGRQSPRTTIL